MTRHQWKKEFSKRLKNRMDELCINQTELSERTGIPNNSICMYVNGKTIPQAIAIPKLAKELKLNVSDLIDF